MRYLVGVDDSAPAAAALRWALARAEQEGVPVVLAHVVDPEAGAMGRDFAAEARATGAALLSERTAATAAEHPDLEIGSVLVEGSVPWELSRAVRPDDVLVVGSHKTGFSSGRVLGSRSVQVALAAPCAVAVIPSTDLRFRHDVVAGLDRVETAAEISELASRHATARGEALVLVHATQTRESDDGRTRGVHGDDVLDQALASVRAAHPDLPVRARRTARRPSVALLDASRSAALLVLGRGATGPSRSPIGTVLHEVLLNANSPVLVAPTPA